MLIDWFTVGAQVVNFLVLVWLMKRFLYQPVLDAIEKRRQEIASALAEAEADRKLARQEGDAFRHRNEEFERKRELLLEQARAEADEERRRLLDEARYDAEELRARQREALRKEHERLGNDIARHVRDEIFAIAGKALTDLAGSSLEERMAEIFARRVRDLEPHTRELISAATGPVIVRSAVELSATSRAGLEAALRDWLADGITFRTEPDLIAGFEILFGEQKLSWNIDDHLAELHRRVRELIPDDEETRANEPTAGAP